MRYLSTRGDPNQRRFCEILLEGLAPDGGLYLPEHYPQIDAAALQRLRDVWQREGYAALAFEILSLYIDDIPADDLGALCRKTYTAEVFGSWRAGASNSTSSVPPVVTPAAPPNTPCAASAACACS